MFVGESILRTQSPGLAKRRTMISHVGVQLEGPDLSSDNDHMVKSVMFEWVTDNCRSPSKFSHSPQQFERASTAHLQSYVSFVELVWHRVNVISLPGRKSLPSTLSGNLHVDNLAFFAQETFNQLYTIDCSK